MEKPEYSENWYENSNRELHVMLLKFLRNKNLDKLIEILPRLSEYN